MDVRQNSKNKSGGAGGDWRKIESLHSLKPEKWEFNTNILKKQILLKQKSRFILIFQ